MRDRRSSRFVLYGVSAGALVLGSAFTLSSPTERAEIPVSHSAVSIRFSCIYFTAGFLAPGERADVLLTHSQDGRLTSSIIMQDIEIAAAEECRIDELANPRLGPVVTVIVTDRQAQTLALAQQSGELSLVLRANDLPQMLPPEDYRYGDSRPIPPVLRISPIKRVDRSE